MTDIPVNKAQLYSRSENVSSKWLSGLQNPTWRAARDARSGHTIHVVSDRSFSALASDLHFGLSLMNWMSSEPIVWYWWDQDWPRILPPNTAPGRIHVNGGWAVPGIPEVHVYRREEAHKVLLHEIIHAVRLDIPQTVLDPIRIQFNELLGRTLWPHLGEAFTEFFAEWLWAIASAPSLSAAKKNWTAQLACSDMQAKQIWARIRNSTSEDTSIFAYYVLKWVLMQHSEEVLFTPLASSASWKDWWIASRPILDAESDQSSISKTLRLGMTCCFLR
jgi:hypothetical protein